MMLWTRTLNPLSIPKRRNQSSSMNGIQIGANNTMKKYRDNIDTPEFEIKDSAIGIHGYGIFDNIKNTEDGKFMFVGFQRCKQITMPIMTLSQTLDTFDELFNGLSNLIDALSAIIIIIIETTNIGEEFLDRFEL
ncbi:unnamed protein product [Rotaria sordida]|uniref:Uncharacterized protein n=1 Tax=Rotaria sordida TaxID=392033 RepID=A0A819G3V0_9BILA|nr:unnamed protein product [Rotaria sordida]CAF3877154.1 unnamed protein product [Rotaria sordida]